MADLYTLIDGMTRQGYFQRISANAAAQFGTQRRTLLGASILPERNVDENAFVEDAIRYRTVIANSGTRYSPSQKKGEGLIVGTFQVILGDADIAREFTARDYDALIKVLGGGRTQEATLTLINWADMVLNRALVELNEAQRWDAILDASVVRRGDNGYVETVPFPNPSGHRANAGGTWSNNSYDPYTDITAMVDLLGTKGYTCNRIITSRKVKNILLRNSMMINKLQKTVIINGSGQAVTSTGGRLTNADLDEFLVADGLPPIETYDLTYNTQAATVRFLRDTSMVFLATTGRDENVIVGDNVRPVTDTLGYFAIGRAAGQSAPGRVMRMEAFSNKPPRVEGEAWETGFPVITEPEAVAVINAIA
jgi:hypothetical protein